VLATAAGEKILTDHPIATSLTVWTEIIAFSAPVLVPKDPAMCPHPDPVVYRQLPVIEKIIRDETWLEGERRGRPVPAEDPAVRENVCLVVLRIGRDLRETLADREDAAGNSPSSQSQPAAA
jgi:hypothetical protein